MAADGDLRLLTEHGLFELQRDVFSQVRTALGPSAPAAARAEEIAEAEEVAENLAEVLDRGIEPRRSSNPAYTGVTEAVVGGTFIGIRQNGISFAALFELLFRVGIVGIAVGMELQRQFAVGAFDFLFAGSTGDSEDLVVIAFYVASWNGIVPFAENANLNVWGCVPLEPLPVAAADPSTCSLVATHR